MNILKYLVAQNTQKTQCNFSQILTQQLQSTDPLPQNYHLLFLSMQDTPQVKETKLQELVTNMQTVESPQALIKNLTLILKILEMNTYSEDLVEKLSEMSTPEFDKTPQINLQWLKQLYISCKSYLTRVGSLTDVFHRSTNYSSIYKHSLTSQTMLSDLYLLLNSLALLFPYSTNAINTIGRYYIKTHKYFHQFYRLLRDILHRNYKYMKFIVDSFINTHSQCGLNQLQCFMQSLPQIELMCDKIEQFLMNKYFRGQAPSEKLYLKAQQVEEIGYLLRQRQKMAKDKDDGSTQSAEQQFGQYI